MDDNNNDDEYLEEIRNNKIKNLNCKGREFRIIEIEDLSEVLKYNTSLKELIFSNTYIGNDECKFLSEALQINNSLQVLHLDNNNIENRGCKFLCEALRINNTLKELYLANNKIGDKGYKYLSEALKINYSLQKLDLGKNIEIKEMNILNDIEASINFNKTPMLNRIILKNEKPVKWEEISKRELDLKILNIEQCSLKEIPIDLKNFKNLIVLDLRNNELNSSSIKILCEFIKWNSSLRVLILQENKTITDKEGEELLSSLCSNFYLIECNLTETSISDKIQAKIKSQLKVNAIIRPIFLKYLEIADLIISDQIKAVEEKLNNKSISQEEIQEILFICCVWNKIELCKFILNRSIININFQLQDGNTYLHLSCMKGNEEISKLFLEKGIDVNIKNKNKKRCSDVCVGNCKLLFEDIKQLKVVILGKAEVGKTTLVKKILNTPMEQTERNLYEKIFGVDLRTDGIEMYEWKTGSNINIQLWDFGGQELFYTTHQFFLSENSIHLLLFNLIDPFMEKELFFWLNSIQYRAPKSKVIIVGTHMDKIDPNLIKGAIVMSSELIKTIYEKVISLISPENRIEVLLCSYWETPEWNTSTSRDKIWFYPISGIKGWNLKHLANLITGFSFNMVVRQEFIQLKNKIFSLRNEKINLGKNPLLLRNELKDIILQYFNNRNEEIEKNIKLLHELGYILDFGMKFIIIYPQWLSYVFKSVISLKRTNQIKNGIISRSQIISNLLKELNSHDKLSFINKISKSSDSITKVKNPVDDFDEHIPSLEDIESFEFLLDLMQKFQICIPKPGEYKDANERGKKKKNFLMIIPCLFEKQRLKEADSIFSISNVNNPSLQQRTNLPQEPDKEILGRKYYFPFLPRGVFEQLFFDVTSFIGDDIKFWKNGFYITANEERGYLMLEIKVLKSQSQTTKQKVEVENLYKGSVIEIKSTGYLSHYLISAFHFCIKELFEKNYSLLWRNVSIEVEYFYKDDFYSNSLFNCLELWKTNKTMEIKSKKELPIPWKKLIPETLDYNLGNIEKLIVNSIKYIPGAKIGEGKFGEVFLCKATDRPGVFAIKQFKIMKELDYIKRSKIQKSFQTEIDIMKELDHPNLTKLIGYDQRGDIWLLVFPLYDTSLEKIQNEICKMILDPKGLTRFPLEDKVVQENYWWTLDQILFFYEEILKGLDYLHSKSIAHLDLKSENILLCLNKEQRNPNDKNNIEVSIKSIHIHDFGSSYKAKNENDKICQFVGSFYHMSPEIKAWANKEGQLRRPSPYDPFKADIFSFGILLCEIVANTAKLYRSETLHKLKDHKFEKVILDCLKNNPDERPNTEQLLQYFR